MPRDVNDFISEALKEGHGMDEIVDFMSKHKDESYKTWASNWSSTAAAPEYKAGSADQDIRFEEKTNQLKSDYEKKLKEATTTNVLGVEIPSVLTGAGTGIIATAGAVAAGLYGAKKLQDRSIKNPQVAEAVGDVAKQAALPTELGDYTKPAYQRAGTASPFDIQPAPEPNSAIQALQKRVEAGREAGIGQAPVQPPVQAQQAVAPVQPPVAAQPSAPMAQQTPAIADAVATGDSPAKSIQMDVAKQIEATPTAAVAPPEESGVKKRAAKTTQTFKSAEKLPEGITFRADLGPGDNWLFNTYGSEGRKAILAQFNEGKPAVSYERAKELSQMVQQERTGPAIPRDIAKERGIAPPETNYGKLGKAVKVAGAAGLGLTAAQMALAAQQAKEGDYSAAREFGFNLLGMIPGLGAAFNLGTYAPEVGAGEQKELAKRRRMVPTID